MPVKGTMTEKNLLKSFAGESQARKRYRDLHEEIDKMFCKDEKVVWRCLNCGFIHEGKEAPLKCPACDHPQAWFEKLEG